MKYRCNRCCKLFNKQMAFCHHKNKCEVDEDNAIVYVKFGDEDLSKLTVGNIREVLETGMFSPVTLTEMLHFNESIPEYQNITVIGLPDRHVAIHDGEKWITTNRDKVISKLYNDAKTFIAELAQTPIYEDMPQNDKNAIRRLLDMDESDKTNKKTVKRIKKDINHTICICKHDIIQE